jgi:hypothetical protein
MMANSASSLFLALDQSAAWIEADASWQAIGVLPVSVAAVAGHTLCAINTGLPQPSLGGLPMRVHVYTDPRAPCPLTHGGASPIPDVAIVRVKVASTYWCQLVYQFSHELGHIVSNSWGERWSPGTAHMWLEEACCGALSLLALERMAERWAAHNVFGDASYAAAFRDYLAKHLGEYSASGSLTPDTLQSWWVGNEGPLATGESLNGVNMPFAALLYGQMCEKPALWHDMRALNRWPRPVGLSLGDHLEAWEEHCAQLGTLGGLPRWCRENIIIES